MLPIKGFENYLITKDGMLFSKKNNKYMCKNIKNTGYLQVNLYKNGKFKTKLIHRLVAETYINNPNNFKQVNHINGIKDDNRVENLEWVTAKQNTIHAWKIGLCKNSKLQRDKATKTHSKVVLDMQYGIFYNSVKEASICLGMYYPMLKNMLNGATKNKTSLCYV
jgi:hypothetical protein